MAKNVSADADNTNKRRGLQLEVPSLPAAGFQASRDRVADW